MSGFITGFALVQDINLATGINTQRQKRMGAALMRKAEWLTDYDMHLDKCFQRPQCPECYAPIFEYKNNEFRCISCKNAFDLDEKMKRWVRERAGTKVEMQDCPADEFEFKGKMFKLGCGGKGCVETHYIKNDITLEWQVAWGCCKNCGRRFIV